MLEKFPLFIILITVAIVFSPIYFLRRKTARMADDDLKRVDMEDWERQKKFGSYTRLISRVVWGGSLVAMALLNTRIYEGWMAGWLIFCAVSGILLIVWGLLGFRRELIELNTPR